MRRNLKRQLRGAQRPPAHTHTRTHTVIGGARAKLSNGVIAAAADYYNDDDIDDDKRQNRACGEWGQAVSSICLFHFRVSQ